MIDKVIGSVVPLARLPLTLVEGIESVIEQATRVATRAAAVVDRAEPIAGRIEALLDRAEDVPDRIDALLVRSGAVADEVHALVASLSPAAAALADLEPAVVSRLLGDVVELLPALRSLEQLVPVVGQLSVQVDNLDRTVADVGALLGGIPGAARLLKRGETSRPAR